MCKVVFILQDLEDDTLDGKVLTDTLTITSLPDVGHEVYFEPMIKKWKDIKRNDSFILHPQNFVVKRVVLDVSSDEYNIWVLVPTTTLQFV